jgi:hypothetical protein
MIRKQITMCIKNKPGALAGATRAMARASVNIEALSMSESTEVGLVRMIVSHPDAARKVLDAMDIACLVENVAVVPLENKPGKIADFAARLAKETVNINYIYGGTAPNSDLGLIVISASDLDAVAAIWRQC